MDQEAVDAAVAVLERMEEHECVGDGRGVDHGMDGARLQAPVGGDQPFHEALQGGRFRAYEVDDLSIDAHGLAHVVLRLAVAGIAKTRIDDSVLQVDQGVSPAMILKLGVLQ